MYFERFNNNDDRPRLERVTRARLLSETSWIFMEGERRKEGSSLIRKSFHDCFTIARAFDSYDYVCSLVPLSIVRIGKQICPGDNG